MSRSPARICFGMTLLMMTALVLTHVPPTDAAPPPRVNAATPDNGEQETFNLEVTIDGQNFDNGSDVAFWRTGTTNPGGVEVTGVVFHNPNRLVATVDIELSASIDDFDIEVTTSRGRRGKGIELFRVTEKIHPNCGDGQCQGNEDQTCPEDCIDAPPDPKLLATARGDEVGAGGYFGEFSVVAVDVDNDSFPMWSSVIQVAAWVTCLSSLQAWISGRGSIR